MLLITNLSLKTYLIRFSDFSLFNCHRETPVTMNRKTLQGSILGPDQFKLEINNHLVMLYETKYWRMDKLKFVENRL